jgi:peptidyl-prolyl cis-trans isomerase A (cyclophilin A)
MSRRALSSCIALLATLAAAWAVAAAKPADTKASDKTPDKAAAAAVADKAPEPMPSKVRVDTNLGSFTIQLELARAPLTVSNFVQYVRDGQYNGIVFHRVVSNFIVQAGGYDKTMTLRSAVRTVANESGNGLSNKRGTVGLARTDAPHSGNAQFYVNLTDNEELDPTPLRWGYAVFGKIVDGMDVVDKIGKVPTGSGGPFPKDVPLDPIVIEAITPIP